MRLVLIEWIDSFGCSSTWQELDDIEKPTPMICRSVGWLLSDDDKCVVIVPHVTDEHKSTPRQGCGDMTIPRVCIVCMKDLVAVPMMDLGKDETGSSLCPEYRP